MNKKKKKGRYGRGLVSGLMAVCLVAILSLGITVSTAQQGLSPVEQLTRLAEVSGENFGKALDYLGSSSDDNQTFGALGDEPTNITDARPGRLQSHTNVFVSDDLEVDGTSYFDGAVENNATTTSQEITLGSRFSNSLDFSAGATTTPGGLFSVQNTGEDKLCSVAIVDITTATSQGGIDADGAPLEFSVATSTAASAFSGNVGIIASTTLATSTTALFDNVQNPGTYVNADQDIGGATFEWNNSVYLLGQFDAYLDTTDRTSATSSDTYSGVAGKYYIHCITR